MNLLGNVRSRLSAQYDPAFYRHFNDLAIASAEVLVPKVLDLLGTVNSVADLGCGAGAWLRVFSEHGVPEYIGMDGTYVREEQLLIPVEHFLPTDLTARFFLEKRFDLVLCLEVAEHLDARYAEGLIDDIVATSDAVLFSAAIPYQGGLHHVNEQWPSYWNDMFRARGFVGLDPFRMTIWEDERVAGWFAQNLVLYVKKSRLLTNERLDAEYQRTQGAIPPLVHPSTYAPKARVMSAVMNALPIALLSASKRWLGIS